MSTPYFVPVADLLPYWPHDLVAPSDLGIFGRLIQYFGITEFDLVEYEDELTMIGKVALWQQMSLDLPLVDGVALVLGQPGPNLSAFPFELSFGPPSGEVTGGVTEQALDLFLKGRPGPYQLLLPAVDVGLRFDPEKLRPMRPKDAADLTKGFEPDPTVEAVQLNFRAAITIDTATGFRLEAPGDLDLPFCQIGSTGVVIRAQDLVFRLSDDQPFPEGIDPAEFDLEPDWKGVYLGRVQVFNLRDLCEWLPASLDLEKWFLGQGGVTGKGTAVFDLAPDMTSQDFAVRAFRLAFRQNALIEGLVQLAVKLPYFDHKVVYLDLEITHEPSLDFPESIGFMGSVAGEQPPDVPGEESPPRQDELIALPANPVFRLGARKLGVRSKPDPGRARGAGLPEDTRFWDILLDGRVEIAPSSTIANAGFGGEFTGLGIQVAPEFELLLPGGLWLSMNEAARTKLSAFPLQISRIGFGKEGLEKWAGLDAAIDFGKGIGPAASVKGLRVYFGGPPGVHLAFDGIALKLVRPGFTFEGSVSMTTGADPQGVADPSDRTFRGDVLLAIASGVGVELQGSVLFGTKGGTRFGYVGLDATFGSGIPLSAGVSWFGAALLAGVNVAPNRTLAGNQGENFRWYDHWYAPAPAPFSVLHSSKWAPQEDAWAGGAGVTIGSSDGKAWSLRALLAVVAPGPVIVIEGRLRLLKRREPHSGPPQSTTIRGLVVLDFDQGDFLLALEVDYKLPESGLLADVHAAGEVFYGHRPGDWHVAIGWPEPISRRVRSRALKLLDWDFYFVLTGRDLVLAERTFPGTALALGYRTGIDKRGKWGPIRAVFAVWIAGDVAMSFDPFYILAQLALHGEVSVKVYGIGFELMLDALLALEAPVNGDDLFFGGKVTIKLGLPWPLPDVKKDIPFSWGDESGLPPPITPLVDGATVSPGYSVVGERFYERAGAPIPSLSNIRLPLDGRVTVAFQRPLRSTWAGAPTPVDLARPDLVGDVYYRYTLTGLRVVVTPAAGAPHAAAEDLFGQWTIGHGDAHGPQAESLVLWGLTPFPAAGNLAWPGRTERRSWVDLLFDVYTTWPCGTVPEPERCVDFDAIPAGTYEPELRWRPDPAFGAVAFRPWPDPARPEDLAGELEKLGEPVQVLLAVVNEAQEGPPRHCLQLARTTFLGGLEGQDQTSGPVTDGVTVWGVSLALPPSRKVRGRIEHNRDIFFVGVVASKDGEAVAAVGLSGPDFEIDAGDKTFDRVVIQAFPRSPRSLKPGQHLRLCKLCYTTAGALATAEEAQQQQQFWLHLLGPLTVQQTETNDDRFGAHLVHEPNATYRIELDVRTESAAALDDPWTDHGVATEILTVATGGAPEDLTPYVQTLVPGDGERPVYADYDLRITYNQPYVEAMYKKAGELLYAELFTANGRRVEPEVVRRRTVQPAITPETAVLLDRVRGASCIEIDVTEIAGYDETVYRTRLAPSTAYEARIRGGLLAEPVYRWSFVTSRYRTFAAHLADRRELAWHERLPAAINWAVVGSRLGPPGSNIDRGAEDEAWRTVWQDDFGFPLRTLPERTEVTLFWSQGSTPATLEARAMAFASPEPLFASERTVLTLQRKVTALDPNGGPPVVSWHPVAHRLLCSRDGARALLVPLATGGGGGPAALAAGELRIDFTFRLTGVAGLPDLTRQGAASDETGSWPLIVPATPSPIVDPEA